MILTLDFRFAPWPQAPVDAAGYFYREVVPQVRAALAGEGLAADIVELATMEGGWQAAIEGVAVIFPPAGREDRVWRLGAIQELAREAAPRRVIGIAGDDDAAIVETVEWLAGSPGVTGQMLEVDGNPGARG